MRTNYVSKAEFENIIINIIVDATGMSYEDAELMYCSASSMMPTVAAQFLFLMNEYDTERAEIIREYLFSLDSSLNDMLNHNNSPKYYFFKE